MKKSGFKMKKGSPFQRNFGDGSPLHANGEDSTWFDKLASKEEDLPGMTHTDDLRLKWKRYGDEQEAWNNLTDKERQSVIDAKRRKELEEQLSLIRKDKPIATKKEIEEFEGPKNEEKSLLDKHADLATRLGKPIGEHLESVFGLPKGTVDDAWLKARGLLGGE